MASRRIPTLILIALAWPIACTNNPNAGAKTSSGGTQGPVGATGGSAGLNASGGQTSGGATGGGGAIRDASLEASVPYDGREATGGVGGRDAAADSGQGVCPAGWQLAWSDEFNGPAGSAADTSKWVYESGNGSNGWGNSELEYYRTGSANGAMDGQGNLVITAKQEPYSGFQYTSARLKTQGLATWTYGHIEARIKIPLGQGMWPAFWLLGDDIATNGWPGSGEIDVMENIGKEPTKVHGTIHGPGYSGGSGPTAVYTLASAATFADDFHTFAIEWEQSAIRWSVDGQVYATKTPQDIGSGNTWVYTHPFFILLNLAVGGQWPGNPDNATTFPQTMTVDYVRVCQK